MSTVNPLLEGDWTDHDDRALVVRAKAGDRRALEELGGRHQAWIYNIAIRMLAHPQDAEDATKEILIKALTRLSSFEGRSSFRTWLYRIVVNHVLNAKRGRAEPMTTGFECYAHGLDSTPDLDLPDQRTVPADLRLRVDEARIIWTGRCTPYAVGGILVASGVTAILPEVESLTALLALVALFGGLSGIAFERDALDALFGGLAGAGVPSVYVEHINLSPYIRRRLWRVMRTGPQEVQDIYREAGTIEHRDALDTLVAELLQKHDLALRLSRVLYHPDG